jgi:hypothetical protein
VEVTVSEAITATIPIFVEKTTENFVPAELEPESSAFKPKSIEFEPDLPVTQMENFPAKSTTSLRPSIEFTMQPVIKSTPENVLHEQVSKFTPVTTTEADSFIEVLLHEHDDNQETTTLPGGD